MGKNGKLKSKLLLEEYYENFHNICETFVSNQENIDSMEKSISLLKASKSKNKMIYLVGNGGSSAVAEHAAIDFTKNAGLKALAVSGSPMLTTFSNDYGYENVFKKFIEKFAEKEDILIAISSGGKSRNILNACDEAKNKKMDIITLSGFSGDNPLRRKGDINFWIESKAFGFLEIIHSFILHWINDSIIGSEEYMIR